MRKNWKQISIDDERQVSSFHNYKQFEELLQTVCIPDPGRDLFPRPDQTTPITSYGIIAVYDSSGSGTLPGPNLPHEGGSGFQPKSSGPLKRTSDGPRSPPKGSPISSPREGHLEYYCTQRRTTLEFGEIVKCAPRQKNLFEYLSCMTPKERGLLCNKPHERLWNDLLLDEASLFRETFKTINSTFECYDGILEQLIDLTESNTEEPPWEFPKGRPKAKERTHLQAALREMEEEGKIRFESGGVILLWDDVVRDVYRGTDGQLYETVYFVVKAESRYEPPLTHLDTNCISEHCLSLDMVDYTWIKLAKTGKPKKGSTPLCDRLEKMLFKLHRKLTST